MTTEPTITSERIDDFPRVLAVMLQLGLPGIFDHHLGRHGLHQGLSWGWIATIWLATVVKPRNSRFSRRFSEAVAQPNSVTK